MNEEGTSSSLDIVNNIKARYNYPRLKFKMFSHGNTETEMVYTFSYNPATVVVKISKILRYITRDKI